MGRRYGPSSQVISWGENVAWLPALLNRLRGWLCRSVAKRTARGVPRRAAPAGLDSSPSSIVFAERTAGMPMASGGERSASPLSRVAVDRRLALLCSAKCLFAGTAGAAERAASTMSPVVPFTTLIRTTTTTPTRSPNNSAMSGAPTICGCTKETEVATGTVQLFWNIGASWVVPRAPNPLEQTIEGQSSNVPAGQFSCFLSYRNRRYELRYSKRCRSPSIYQRLKAILAATIITRLYYID